MSRELPPAHITRKYFDESFDSQTPVWALQWDEAPGEADRLWELPEGLCIVGPAPRQFGIRLTRHGDDGYSVRVRWDHSQLSWAALSKVEVLGSCLAPLLAALGRDLWSMLELPLAERARGSAPPERRAIVCLVEGA